MTENIRLIKRRLGHLRRMGEYLAWSRDRVADILPISDWQDLTPEQHETLAAFRVRFSEFQEQMGKTMRSIAIEEEEPTEPFGGVLAFMEKLEIIDSAEHWKLIRELRNSINHEYEENPERLSEFFQRLFDETGTLVGYYGHMADFAVRSYGGE